MSFDRVQPLCALHCDGGSECRGVAGFIEPIVKELPMEYSVEMNRLIEINMAATGAVG